jgi:hypothetical protein
VKRWRGDYVIVFPRSEWKFYKCVVCGRGVKFGTEARCRVSGWSAHGNLPT